MSNWQPIETAPRDGRWILLVSDEGKKFVARWGTTSNGLNHPEGGWVWAWKDQYFGDYFPLYDNVVRWHPLP